MASAGTGKTFQLAMRFIQLLRFGADPSEILAVTFTKKAAGEIFDKIINRLLELAEAGENAASFNTCEAFERSQFLELLRRLLETRRELQIGTIDSFFRKLTDVYAPELGIWGGITLIDAHDSRYRRRALRNWLREINAGNELDALRELLKMANRDEQKSFSQTMDELVNECHPFFLAHASENLEWGRIPFLFGSDGEELTSSVATGFASRLDDAMEVLLASEEKHEEVSVRRMKELAKLCLVCNGAIGRLPKDVRDLFQNLADKNGTAWETAYGTELVAGRNWKLAANISDLVRRLFCHVRAILARQARVRSNAVYQLMANYDAVYHREVRAAGLLTFADIPYLLQTRRGESTFRLFANDRVNLEERLDAQLNHYLFDEFQDTSDLQWNAFDNLLDELVNDPDGRFRTFFCVGDIKQSIYRFRQGNPRLFGRVIAKTKTPPETLTLSRRSAPQVMALVNRLFDAPKTHRGFLSAVSRLNFATHAAYNPAPGFAALIEFLKCDRYDDCLVDKADFILQAMLAVQPFQRGLSVGILMRNNSHLREFAQILQTLIKERHLDLSLSIDGTLSVLESPAVELFLQLLILSRHPGDESARVWLSLAHFGGAPLSWKAWGEALALGEIDDASALSRAVRHALDRDGISGVADRFAAGFGKHFTEFDRRMFEVLRQMAAEFSGDPDDFRDRLQWQQAEEKSLAGTIQLMTIHKSKGLEFDLVFVVEFDSPHSGAKFVPEVDVPDAHDPEAVPKWIGYLPDEAVAKSLPGGAKFFADREEEENYDDSCTVYVALTRAKKALYLLFAEAGKSSTQPEAAIIEALASDDATAQRAQYDFRTQMALLHPESVCVRFAAGNSDFFTGIAPEKISGAATLARDVGALKVVSRRTPFARPSAVHGGVARGIENCFDAAHGAETGTLIHALFEKIAFLDDDFDAEKFLAENSGNAPLPSEVRTLFCDALAEVEIADALKTPAPEVELWREKDFLHQTAKGVVSGTFDRVVLIREKGKIVRAEILDYKSDHLATEAEFLERHATQLQIYREALAAMTKLEPAKICCALLALRLGKKISVPLDR